MLVAVAALLEDRLVVVLAQLRVRLGERFARGDHDRLAALRARGHVDVAARDVHVRLVLVALVADGDLDPRGLGELVAQTVCASPSHSPWTTSECGVSRKFIRNGMRRSIASYSRRARGARGGSGATSAGERHCGVASRGRGREVRGAAREAAAHRAGPRARVERRGGSRRARRTRRARGRNARTSRATRAAPCAVLARRGAALALARRALGEIGEADAAAQRGARRRARARPSPRASAAGQKRLFAPAKGTPVAAAIGDGFSPTTSSARRGRSESASVRARVAREPEALAALDRDRRESRRPRAGRARSSADSSVKRRPLSTPLAARRAARRSRARSRAAAARSNSGRDASGAPGRSARCSSASAPASSRKGRWM